MKNEMVEQEVTVSAEKPKKEYNLAKTPFSWDKLDGLLAHKSSLLMCEELLDCPSTTIRDHIKARFGLTFSEYQDKKLSVTKLKLVQKAIQMAMNGNVVMTIFCLKNINKWQDKFDIEEEDKEDKRVVHISYKTVN